MATLTDKYKRLNIIDLKNNHPVQFGNFMMALKNLEDSDDWYRICGIHGNLFKPNDKKVLCPTDLDVVTAVSKTGEPFYCKHKVTSFIAWHTPYIYQFELLLNKYNTSTNKDYITLPYLDLTDITVDFTFFNQDKITIKYEGADLTIDNPLCASNVYYYDNGVKTKVIRNGFLTPKTKKDRMQIETVKKQLNNVLYADTYEKFSSLTVSYVLTKAVSTYTPLETPHNSIHDILGGEDGNMSEIVKSAFDPVFWLHHCNMDRHFYTWLSNNTKAFTKPLSSKKMTKETRLLTMAPFFPTGIYKTDYKKYKYGWQNQKFKYMLLKDMLKFTKYPFTYDLIVPTENKPTLSFVELIDITIPMESTAINIYMHKKNSKLNKEKDYAGTSFWFGINRNKLNCLRCNLTRTNFKVDIDAFVNQNKITKENINDYNVVVEGAGRLIRDEALGFKLYSHADIVKDGLVQVVIN